MKDGEIWVLEEKINKRWTVFCQFEEEWEAEIVLGKHGKKPGYRVSKYVRQEVK